LRPDPPIIPILFYKERPARVASCRSLARSGQWPRSIGARCQ